MKMLLDQMSDGRVWTFAQAKRVAFSNVSEGDATRALQLLRSRGFIKDDYRRPDGFKITEAGASVSGNVSEAQGDGTEEDGAQNIPQGAPNAAPQAPAAPKPYPSAPQAPQPPKPPVAPQQAQAPQPAKPIAPAAPAPAPAPQAQTAAPNPADVATANLIANKMKSTTNASSDPTQVDAAIQQNMATMGKTQNTDAVTALVKQQMGVQEGARTARRAKGK